VRLLTLCRVEREGAANIETTSTPVANRKMMKKKKIKELSKKHRWNPTLNLIMAF
jgi:hypothetical protein